MPVLIASAHVLRSPQQRRTISGLARRAKNAIDGERPGIVDVGLAAELYRAMEAANLKIAKPSRRLCGVANSINNVEVAQYAYYAAQLECAGARPLAIDPPSRSGWVEPDVIAKDGS